MMKCNHCGQDFGDGLNCKHCGIDRVEGLGSYSGFRPSSDSVPFHEEPTVLSNNTKTSLCFKCGEIIPANSSFCPYCGTPLFVTCPACKKKHPSQYPFCPYCGTNSNDTISQIEESQQNNTHDILANKSLREGSIVEKNENITSIVRLQGIEILESNGSYYFLINGVKQEQYYSYAKLWREWSHGYLFVVKQLGGGRRRAILNFSRNDSSLRKVSDFVFPDVDFDGDILYDYRSLDYVICGKKRIVTEVNHIFGIPGFDGYGFPVLRVPLAMNSIDNIPSDGTGEAWLILSLDNEWPVLYFYELIKHNALVVKHYVAKSRWSWNLYKNESRD